MIVGGILNIFKGLILMIVNLFPALPDLSFLVTTMTPFFNFLKTCNLFVDIGFMAKCILVCVVFMNIRIVWSATLWLVRKIPGLG